VTDPRELAGATAAGLDEAQATTVLFSAKECFAA
jgi:hypothetical protein